MNKLDNMTLEEFCEHMRQDLEKFEAFWKNAKPSESLPYGDWLNHWSMYKPKEL